MKIALFMIMCSGITGQCLDPHKLNTHDDFYSCMTSGYEESLNKTLEIGQEQVNEHKIFIKFVCAKEEQEEKKGSKINV